MPKPISRRDVTARAEQVLNQRREAVNTLADAQGAVDDLTAAFARELEDLRAAQSIRLKDAATQNTRAWASALSAGWSEDELRQLGFTEPEVKTRARRTRKTSSTGTAAATSATATTDQRDKAPAGQTTSSGDEAAASTSAASPASATGGATLT